MGSEENAHRIKIDAPETQPENESKADEKEKNPRGHKLAERIAQLGQPPESLDFTISGVDCEYKVHSSVICSRSRFFERAVKGRFVEATAKRLHLPEEDADSLELLISILYGFESTYSAELWPEGYEDIRGYLNGVDQTNHYIIPTEPSTIDIEGSSDSPQENTGLRLLRLYALIDRFDIFWLQRWAKNIVLLWAKANTRSPSFIEVIQAVYRCETGNYTELVDGIFALVVDNVDLLIDNEDFYEVVVENGELGAELLRHIILTNRIADSALDMHSSLMKLHNIGGKKLVNERVKLQLRTHHMLAEFSGLAKASLE
ncbi:hypothetical protein EMPG_16451 [Blastomyces silverae]|uniref:BTB domain-containing protein n=1 Tax=Blastomyces silverae TaxID=2060906 RepID=A0A0H1BAH6_9EURO|nr:hypothetical protein EMPG_16451 [Blastomyces silverae]